VDRLGQLPGISKSAGSAYRLHPAGFQICGRSAGALLILAATLGMQQNWEPAAGGFVRQVKPFSAERVLEHDYDQMTGGRVSTRLPTQTWPSRPREVPSAPAAHVG